MARPAYQTAAKPKPTFAKLHPAAQTAAKPKPTFTKPRMSNAERSAYFARREAAKVLRVVLQGDARRRAVASIKTLALGPTVRNKKATFALVCETLKHLAVIKEVLEIAKVLNSKWKRQEELIYIITYDILFSQAIVSSGDAEKFLLLRKTALESALARLFVRKKVKCVEELLSNHQTPGVSKPRYVRVNTLKLDFDSAFLELSKHHKVQKDDMIQDLLVLPSGSDLHDHPLVINGSVLLQGRASSMVALALGPKPEWEVLDACSAPGNKTVHLAALMQGKGKLYACEHNNQRVELLKNTIRRSGATNVQVLNRDFLDISTEDPMFSKVRAILLDPSCSGSGTVADRLDHLLPSYATAQTSDFADSQRIYKLAAFQKKALVHALSFPAVERVVYSTCSVNQTENEDVVNSVLSLATSLNFQLETPFPQWPRRGLPVFEGSEHLLRTDPVEDMEGFFIALFVKRKVENLLENHKEKAQPQNRNEEVLHAKRKSSMKRKCLIPYRCTRMSRMLLHCKTVRRPAKTRRDLQNSGDSRPSPLSSTKSDLRKHNIEPAKENHAEKLDCKAEVGTFINNLESSDMETQRDQKTKLGGIVHRSFISTPEPGVNLHGTAKIKRKKENMETSLPCNPLDVEYVAPTETVLAQARNGKDKKLTPRRTQVDHIVRGSECSRLIVQLPECMAPYIQQIGNPKSDGNCGFRVIAALMGMGESNWSQVRKDLANELESHRSDYLIMYGSERYGFLRRALKYFQPYPPFSHWMTMPDMGHLVASRYNVVFVYLSKCQSLTFLPLRSVPILTPNRRIITAAFVNGNHFIALTMNRSFPMPPVASHWYKYKRSCATGWETPYVERIRCFREMVGLDKSNQEIIDLVDD